MLQPHYLPQCLAQKGYPVNMHWVDAKKMTPGETSVLILGQFWEDNARRSASNIISLPSEAQGERKGEGLKDSQMIVKSIFSLFSIFLLSIIHLVWLNWFFSVDPVSIWSWETLLWGRGMLCCTVCLTSTHQVIAAHTPSLIPDNQECLQILPKVHSGWGLGGKITPT